MGKKRVGIDHDDHAPKRHHCDVVGMQFRRLQVEPPRRSLRLALKHNTKVSGMAIGECRHNFHHTHHQYGFRAMSRRRKALHVVASPWK